MAKIRSAKSGVQGNTVEGKIYEHRVLIFDDKQTREQRRSTDKFAAVRDLWNSFVAQCKDIYSPSECLTVDEQLLGFRGRCPFRQYIRSKPDTYGLKI